MDLRIKTQLGPGTNHIFCYLGLDMAGSYSDLALAIPNCSTENLSYFWWKLWHRFFLKKPKTVTWFNTSLEKWNLQQFFLGSKFHESWETYVSSFNSTITTITLQKWSSFRSTLIYSLNLPTAVVSTFHIHMHCTHMYKINAFNPKQRICMFYPFFLQNRAHSVPHMLYKRTIHKLMFYQQID